MAGEILRLVGLNKSFGGLQALDDVSLSLFDSEVLALLGDNGAGKSTLIKVISGIYPLDSGEIFIKGKPAVLRSARDAIELGIETIHQDTSLAPDLSIARNLFLGREPVRIPALGVLAPLNRRFIRGSAVALLRRVGISRELDADAPVRTLSGGERQSIAIARAMQFLARVIILDEPTNNLGVEETQSVLRFVKEAKAAGHSVIFVTHNLPHVFQVADRILVMRQGRITAELKVGEADLLTIESIITGADVSSLLVREGQNESAAKQEPGDSSRTWLRIRS
jgi:simple sugar transport system ATP-binding protein